MNRDLRSVILLSAVVAIVGGACGSTAASPTSASGGTTLATSAVSAGSSASTLHCQNGNPCSIGIVTFSATDVAVNQVVKGAQKVASDNGWTSSVVDANGSPDAANSAIEDYVQKKVDAVIVTVFPTDSLGAGLAATRAAGIPLLSEGGGLAAGVAISIDLAIGDVVASRLKKDLNGDGSVLALNYTGGLPCRLRYSSYQDMITATPGIKSTLQEVPVPGQVEAGASATLAWLAAHPAGSGNLAVWACFDDPAMGAISAIKQTGRTGIKVYGFNGNPDALAAIRDGSMTATLWLDDTGFGTQLAKAVPDIIAAGPKWVPKVVAGTNILVDKSNLDQFLKDHPEQAPAS